MPTSEGPQIEYCFLLHRHITRATLTFLVAVTEYLTKRNLKKRGFMLAHSLKGYSYHAMEIMAIGTRGGWSHYTRRKETRSEQEVWF